MTTKKTYTKTLQLKDYGKSVADRLDHIHPGTDLTSYIAKVGRKEPHYKTKVVQDFPCMTCYGRGKIGEPNFPYDVIEGYKGRPLITCPTCKGTGEGHKALYQDYYKQELREWKKLKKKYDAKMLVLQKVRQKLFKRLTLDELEAIDWNEVFLY